MPELALFPLFLSLPPFMDSYSLALFLPLSLPFSSSLSPLSLSLSLSKLTLLILE